jgi:uncharacterized membrane protein (UPF0127 family)
VSFEPSSAQLRVLRSVITAVLCASLLSCVVRGADSPADPSLAPVGAAHRTLLPGFSETRVTVRAPSGSVFSWCLLLAATAQLRGQGLMNVTDATLGGYDGMLFRWADADVSEQFYMRNTPLPLSLAYLDANGQLVTAVDMTPCDDSADCPLYPAAGPYRFAIEVPQGGLARLGIQPGAAVTDDKVGCG